MEHHMADDKSAYTEVLEKYVRPSAAELDIEKPGWVLELGDDRKKIEDFLMGGEKGLNMASPSRCMLHKLYGSYLLGKKALGLSQEDAIRRGFCPKGNTLTATRLQRAWLQEGLDRLLKLPVADPDDRPYADFGWEILREILTGRPIVQV